ncbi:MAG: hypothetical protein U0414_03440 [Polyangiaceae bacterium]
MKVEAIDHDHAIGTSEGLLLCVWRMRTTAEAITELNRILTRLIARSPDRIVMLTVVESGADMPDAPVRNALAELFHRVAPSVIASALVFEGTGFKAATVRALTTTLNMVTRQPFPHKVFATVAEASAWLAPPTAGRLLASQIASELAGVRAALDARGQAARL